jgi:parvulin-like peptidyl-prolyl isomerase
LLAIAWARASAAPASAAPASATPAAAPASTGAEPSAEKAPAAQETPAAASAPEPASAGPSDATTADGAGKAAPKAKAAKGGSAKGGAKTAKAKGPAAVVITVGPSKIRRNQIDTLVDLMVKARHQDGSSPQPGEREYIEKMVATNLIGQQLLDLEAKRLNVVADPKSLDSLSKAFRANFPNEEAFQQALRQAGDTEAGLREKMARQIKADKLLNAQMSPVERPSEKEMKDFFAAHKSAFPVNDSLRACQILFRIDPSDGAAEIAKKKNELEQIRANLAMDTAQIDVLLTRFVMKAREISDGPEKKDGGDLQRFLPGDFNPEFKKQVTALKVGQMSPVFRTPLGWHLVVLTERNDGKFESYRLQIARALVTEKAAKAGKDLKKYLQVLAERYKVAYLDDGYRDSTVAGVYDK